MQLWPHRNRNHRWIHCAGWELLLVLVALITLSGCQGISGASQQTTPPSNQVRFGKVAVGTTKTLAATATNNAKAVVTVANAVSSANQLSQTRHSLPQPEVPMTVAVSQDGTLTIRFTPSATGGSPRSFASTSEAVTVSLSVAGAGFSVDGLNHPVTLVAGDSVTFSVIFTPQFAGDAGGNLAISSTASNRFLNIPLSGTGTTNTTTGTGTTTSQVTVSPASLSLGNVVVGASTHLPARLSATGASVTVSSVDLSSSEFTLSGISFPTTIAAGKTVPFTVTFTPRETGTASATASFASNASNSPAVLSLGGTGAPAQVASVTVTSSWVMIESGKTNQFSATAKDAGGNVITGVGFTWNSDAPSVATVDATGLATGVNHGTAHITAFASGVPGIAKVTVNTISAANAALFGLHIHATSTPWPTIGFGAVRLWDTSTRWAQIERSNGVYNFRTIDGLLAELYSHGVTTVVYTFGQVPEWASSHPTDRACDYASWAGTGGCDLPTDINPDGSGSDQLWINFVTALAQHVNDPTYLETHAHIQYWEPWNEFFRNNVVNTFPWKLISVRATYAQMVRMSEDLRCIITGTGSVNGNACTATAIDPTAKILSTSNFAQDCCGLENVFQNLLYCSGTGKNAPIPGSHCTTGARGAEVADIINSHFYTGGFEPEDLALNVKKYKGLLNTADLAKPLWSDESGWEKNSGVPDPDIQASWVARYYLVGWSSGLAEIYWYSYDSSEFGTLWTLSGGLNKAGIAYGQVYNWIVGSSLTTPCSATGTVWTCGLTLANGDAAEAIWDTSQTCSSGSCTASRQNVSSAWTNSQDLAGTNSAITDGTALVGIKPILLTSSAP